MPDTLLNRGVIMRRLWLFTAFILICLSGVSPAEARKVALIIGNGAYANTSPLSNPVNDARIVADAARRAGFDDVTVALNLTANAFQLALRDFRAKANGAEVAMVYYAGHGIEGQGKNWLIPVDAQLESTYDLPYEAIHIDRVMESLSGAKVRMVVLDACRNNPFGRSWQSGTRSVPNGLAGIDVDDVLVIYAAAPGQTAADGTGTNSPFALSLAKRLDQPDLPLQLLGGTVRDDVLAATGGNQRPFVSASITGTPVYLVPRGVVAVAPVAAPPPPVSASPAAPSVSRSALDGLTWKGAVAANTISGYSAYLSEFPEGQYAREAGDRISKLLRPGETISIAVKPQLPEPQAAAAQQAAPLPPSPKPQDAPPIVRSAPVPSASDRTEPAPQIVQDSAKPSLEVAYAFPMAMEPPLPNLPAAPGLTDEGYPNCRNDYQKIAMPFDKAADANRCIVLLDQYQASVLAPFTQKMIDHQNSISAIFTQNVAGQMKYTQKSRDQFFDQMMQEHRDSNPEGTNMAIYRQIEARYQSDREHLQDRFCFYTGCGKYSQQVATDAPNDQAAIANRLSAPDPCKTAGGKSGKVNQAIFIGMLPAELACKLDGGEQAQAMRATNEALRVEQLGAIATWESRTREGVSGSSTIISVINKSAGEKCMTIADALMIDGSETQVAKQLCRVPGSENYALASNE